MGSPVPPGIVQPPWSAAFPADFAGPHPVHHRGRRPVQPLGHAAADPPERRRVRRSWTSNDPEWGAELSEIPDLAKDQTAYEVAVSRLSGSILVSQESIDDDGFPVTQQVSQVLTDTFSNKLDRDLIGPAAAPAPPVPTGILAVAAAADGEDLELAAVAAKASIRSAGGAPSHIVMNPAVLGGLEAARDDLGRRLYDDPATGFAGLQTVISVGATQPVRLRLGPRVARGQPGLHRRYQPRDRSRVEALRDLDPRRGPVRAGGAAAQQGVLGS